MRSRRAPSMAQPLAGTLDVEQASVGRTGLSDELGEVVETALHPEIGR